MAEYVRVRDKETGHHVSILRSQYDRNPNAWALLKSPAAYADGSPRPPKHKTSVAESAADKQASQSAATTHKEK